MISKTNQNTRRESETFGFVEWKEQPIEVIAPMIDLWTAAGIPYVFLIDYSGKFGYAAPDDGQLSNKIWFSVEDKKMVGPQPQPLGKSLEWATDPVPFSAFAKAFDTVMAGIQYGNSYLCNLTFPTPVETNLTLEEIYRSSSARFKVLLPGKFVCFSPEIFVKISENRIASYPMKGTIAADRADAETLILADTKERAEHYTIVDLIRNDLSQVANEVEVERFRYLEKIQNAGGGLLQVSSEISGQLKPEYRTKYGSILRKLLPAGSISGAPKVETTALISATETYDRGYYTGVFGYFDGKTLDSAVLIRFLEQQNDGYVFKSGGGITSRSDVKSEYQELIDKVYVPVF